MNDQEDTIGKWSEDKLLLLKRYLSAYVTVLKGQDWCRGYEYIDGFAGSGRPKSRDQERFVNGSPRVALEVVPSFTAYHFVETSDWRLDRLNALLQDYPARSIYIYPGDCNSILTAKILPSLPYSSFKRAIAFLDPFGMQLNWPTIEAIADTKTIEVMLNFPVMAINRNVRRAHQGSVSPTTRARMNQFWGTDWEAEIYTRETTLFGEEQVLITQSGRDLGERFRKRMLQVFPYCAPPLLMTNSRNAPLYCLIFAGHSPTGVKIATDIFRKFTTMM